MRQTADKLLIAALCIICLWSGLMSCEIPVMLLLTASIVSVINYCTFYIKGRPAKIIRWVSSCIYIMLCLYKNDFIYLLPLLVYDLAVYKMYIASVISLIVIISSVGYEPQNKAVILILCIAAYYIAVKSVRAAALEKETVETRDKITEQNIRLSAQNKNLTENQDYEINLATLKERNRIAGDIHDNVGHMLSRSILQVGALLAVTKDENTRGSLTDIKATLDQAMTSIRTSVHDLHDDAVEIEKSVKDAVSYLPEGCKASMECDRIKDMPTNIKFCFIAAVKESVSNVVKHSNATEFSVVIREHPGFYQLLIKDNGTSSASSDGKGMGLLNMEQRVKELGGTFTVDNTKGYRIFISINKAARKTL